MACLRTTNVKVKYALHRDCENEIEHYQAPC